MHLIASQGVPKHAPFYHRGVALARRSSLAYLFYKLRIDHNLTKKALALRCGVSEEYVTWVESGAKFPSLSFCLKCSKLFDVNPEYVMNRWAREAVDEFRDRLRRRLKLFD
jgi:transcriptional regulator with XRE-family HTH domain